MRMEVDRYYEWMRGARQSCFPGVRGSMYHPPSRGVMNIEYESIPVGNFDGRFHGRVNEEELEEILWWHHRVDAAG